MAETAVTRCGSRLALIETRDGAELCQDVTTITHHTTLDDSDLERPGLFYLVWLRMMHVRFM